MHTDAQQLLKAACEGDIDAVTNLIDLFYGKVFAFLRRLTANDADAADLTQRTFGKVWEALPGFAARSSLSSWIHSIAYHTYVDWRRSNHRTEARSPEWWADRRCQSPTPDEVALRSDLAAALYASVDELEPDLRDTVHLHYYQELSLEETAEAMGVASSTVKYRLRQALGVLERKMNTERTLLNRTTTPKTI
jgi:RNA polymerase sigma-70 factor, ECF subfamily